MIKPLARHRTSAARVDERRLTPRPVPGPTTAMVALSDRQAATEDDEVVALEMGQRQRLGPEVVDRDDGLEIEGGAQPASGSRTQSLLVKWIALPSIGAVTARIAERARRRGAV